MQRYFSSKKENELFVLEKDDLYHIKTVMRLTTGDKIEVVFNKELYIAELVEDKAKEVEKIKLETKSSYITLCIPLLSDQKMSFILQKATELGVDKIVPVVLERSIVKLKDSDKKYVRWNKICKEASEQSKRVDIPVIDKITRLDDLNYEGKKFICSTREKKHTLKSKITKTDTMTFIIGPEGGLTLKEEEKLIELGFLPITLCENVLRVETVPIVLLGIINYEMME